MASRPAARESGDDGSARVSEAEAPAPAAGGRVKESFSSYLHNVKLEISTRVTWPGRKELQTATVVVILTLLVFSAYLGFLDQVFKRALP